MANWWDQGFVPLLQRTGGLTSEYLSTNAKTRSVVVTLPDSAQSSGLSTGFVAWRPTVNIVVQSVSYIPLSADFVNASSSGATLTLYNAAADVIAALSLVGSSSLAQGTVNGFAAVNSTGSAVTANTSITVGLVVSTCCNAPLANLQIDYVTSG